MLKDAADATQTALSLVAKLPDLLRSAKSDSLIEFTKPTRVEPIVLMDDRVVNLSFIQDVMQSLTSIFSGYYLQAVALSVNVGQIDVVKLLDKVNPDRSLDDNVVNGVLNLGLRADMNSMALYEHALPVPGEAVGLEHFGLEASIWDALRQEKQTSGGGRIDDRKHELRTNGSTVSSQKDAVKAAQEVTNLSVGKLLEVEVSSENHKASFPIAVRLVATAAPPSAIVHTLSLGQGDRSVKERWHAWRAGQLSFIRDLVLCQDLIDAHKEGLIKDTSGIYSQSLKRRRKNNLSAIFSGQPSVATASNIVVISDQTRKELERNIHGRLKDFRTREKVFKATYTMLLVVIDPDWESVTIYHRSLEQPTELSASDMKHQSSGKGPDISEILKAYTMGQAPSI